MDRRRFLSWLGIAVGGVALEHAIPFNRVWSFPQQIVLPGSIALPPNSSFRFIEAWDPLERRMIQRLDFASTVFGPLDIPYYVERADRIICPERKVVVANDLMPNCPKDLWNYAAHYFRDSPLRADEFRSFNHAVYPSHQDRLL